jgi:hypothetical protein
MSMEPGAMCVSENAIDKSVTSPARTHALNGTRDFIGKEPGSLIMGIPSGIPALLANVNDGVGVPDIRAGFFSRSRIAPPMRQRRPRNAVVQAAQRTRDTLQNCLTISLACI